MSIIFNYVSPELLITTGILFCMHFAFVHYIEREEKKTKQKKNNHHNH